jgi:hypothetical protein
VTETTMSTDLLQALEIVTKLGVDTVGENLRVLAIDNIALTIEEPGGDLVLGRVLDNGDDSLEFFRGELTSTWGSLVLGPSRNIEPSIPLIEIDIGLLANQVAVSATDTLYLCQGVHDLLLSLDVCIEQTKNLFPVRRIRYEEELRGTNVLEVRLLAAGNRSAQDSSRSGPMMRMRM